MAARDIESALLAQCAAIAQGGSHDAQDQREANVFRLAAMVLQSRHPRESQQLMQASNRYFGEHPGELLPSVDVVRQGWVISLPRLRDMLSQRLRQA